MANKFIKITKETFDEMQFNSAVVLSTFDPTGEKPVADEDVICATSGDITVSCIARMQDLGDDVNGCPPNLAELQKIMGWDCKVGFTSLTVSPAVIALGIGAATVAGTKITPNTQVNVGKDCKDVWIVAEKMNGGMAAVHLKKAMSSSGLSMRFVKNAKGNFPIELTGHPSIQDADPEAAPIDFYSTAAAPAAAAAQVEGKSK